jgi:DNA-binding NarL/FixJ family response regulator
MSSLRVLHVDDDPDVRAVSDQLLSEQEVVESVETVATVDEAIDRLADGGVDCLVSDSLWTADGDPFVAAAQRTAPDVEIVLFSGSDWPTVAADAEAADVRAFVRKGTGSFDALRRTLEAVAARDHTPEGTVVARHDWAGDTEFIEALATTVAAIEAADVEIITPLYHRFDPEALEEFLSSASVPVEVTVPVDGVNLRLLADGTIAVASQPGEDSPDAPPRGT